MTKKKTKTRAERSVENKRKLAEKRKREAAARKSAKKAGEAIKKPAAKKKPAAEKPAIEKSEVEQTPWPRAGDNKEFEDILEDFQQDHGRPPESKPQADESESRALKTADVAEWVKWPFALWSTSQKLPPIIEPREAIEIAEPLARIMNRHGAGDLIPPDVIDGMQVVARTIPVIKHGNAMVKAERIKRAQAGPGQGQTTSAGQAPQGAPQTKPREVGGG